MSLWRERVTIALTCLLLGAALGIGAYLLASCGGS
jgi:hypothetical protein